MVKFLYLCASRAMELALSTFSWNLALTYTLQTQMKSHHRSFSLCVPEVTAIVQQWLRKCSEDERPMNTKACEFCKKLGGDSVQLRLCSKCQTAWYCLIACQHAFSLHSMLCLPDIAFRLALAYLQVPLSAIFHEEHYHPHLIL